MLAAVVANANRDPERRPTPYAVEDFLPGEAVEPETDAEAQAKLTGRLDAAMESLR